MHINRAICDSGRAPVAVSAGRPRYAFTLVELIVVIVIIGLLASLTLAGLAGVRQRAKIEKTKSTIRKIDAVIQPMYESYLTRRVPVTSLNPKAAATERLQNIRTLMAAEMPDNLVDAIASLNDPAFRWAKTPSHSRYRSFCSAVGPTPAYDSSECLFLIVAMGGFDPWAFENFRNDEIGDIDGDNAKEFWDGWGRPIAFIRWPTGLATIAQPQNPVASPDPFDPQKLGNDFALIPLVYSPGPDEALNDPLNSQSNGYGYERGQVIFDPKKNPQEILGSLTSLHLIQPAPGSPSDATAVRDNITNHDLLKK